MMIYTHDLRRSELYIYLFAQDFGDITDLTIYSKLVESFFFFFFFAKKAPLGEAVLKAVMRIPPGELIPL